MRYVMLRLLEWTLATLLCATPVVVRAVSVESTESRRLGRAIDIGAIATSIQTIGEDPTFFLIPMVISLFSLAELARSGKAQRRPKILAAVFLGLTVFMSADVFLRVSVPNVLSIGIGLLWWMLLLLVALLSAVGALLREASTPAAQANRAKGDARARARVAELLEKYSPGEAATIAIVIAGIVCTPGVSESVRARFVAADRYLKRDRAVLAVLSADLNEVRAALAAQSSPGVNLAPQAKLQSTLALAFGARDPIARSLTAASLERRPGPEEHRWPFLWTLSLSAGGVAAVGNWGVEVSAGSITADGVERLTLRDLAADESVSREFIGIGEIAIFDLPDCRYRLLVYETGRVRSDPLFASSAFIAISRTPLGRYNSASAETCGLGSTGG